MMPTALPAPLARCPLCHTASATLSAEALAAGGYWRCVTCGQSWTAQRLATAGAYETWAAARAERLKAPAPTGALDIGRTVRSNHVRVHR
jgi:hypothetical protein